MAIMVESNPMVFGEDVVDLAIEAAGVGGTAILNDKMMAPLASRFVAFTPDSWQAKLADAATSAVTALLGGTVVGMISRPAGRLWKRGGLMYATVKGASVVIPGFSLTGNIPVLGNISWPTLPPPPTNGTNGTTTEALSSPSITSLGI